MKTVAVIPCYNEAKSIGEVVAKSLAHVDKVIVVDNNSIDGTNRAAISAGAWVRLCTTKGAGAATRTGITEALNLGADAIVTLDGDGQHNPEEIPRLLWPLRDNKADMVIGSRFLTPFHIKKYRKFGIDVITSLCNLGHDGVKLTDGQSCFRAFNSKLARGLPIQENGFAFSVEMLIRARRCGFRLMEVPISCIYRDHKSDSTLNPIRHGLSVAYAALSWRAREQC